MPERSSKQVKYIVLVILLFSTLFVMSCTTKNVVIEQTPHTFYGESFLDQSNDTTLPITISTAGVYYNVTGINCGFTNQITCNNSKLTIIQAGFYNVRWSVSFTGGNNNQYHLGVLKSFNTSDLKCMAERHTSSLFIGSLGDGCIFYLEEGDVLSFVVEDKANPPASVTLYHLDFVAVYLGP